MENIEKSSDSSNNKKKTSWSKSIDKGDDHKSIRVEQVENGYIITHERDYKDSKGKYQYETKKYISKTNPVEKDSDFKEEINEKESLFDSIEL